MRQHTSSVTAVLVTVAIAAGLASCSSEADQTASPTEADQTSPTGADQTASPAAEEPADAAPFYDLLPQDVREAGRLVVATDATYPPFEFFDTDNTTLIGADIEIAQSLEGLLGVTLELRNTDFAGIVPGIAAGMFDIAMSGVADTADRREQVSFVDYAANGPAFLVPADAASTLTSWAALCGTTAAVQTGTTMADDLDTASAACEAAGQEPITVGSYQAQDEAVLAVSSQRADLLVTTGGSGAYVVTQSDGQFELVVPSDPMRDPVPLGIVVPKDDPELAEALQAALGQLISDGSYQEIMTRWGLAECCSNTANTINGGS